MVQTCLLVFTLLALEEAPCLVIDFGARYLRVGYSGDDRPTLVLPSAFGIVPVANGSGDGSADSAYFFGEMDLAVPRRDMQVRYIFANNEGTLASLYPHPSY